jgi:hypothetical protein
MHAAAPPRDLRSPGPPVPPPPPPSPRPTTHDPRAMCAVEPGFAPLPRLARLAASGVHRLHVLVAVCSAVALAWALAGVSARAAGGPGDMFSWRAAGLTGGCGEEVALLSESRHWLLWLTRLLPAAVRPGVLEGEGGTGAASVTELQLMALLRVDADPMRGGVGGEAGVNAAEFAAATCWHLPGVFVHAAALLAAGATLWHWYMGGAGAVLHPPEGWLWTRDATGAAASASGSSRLMSLVSPAAYAALVDAARCALVLVPGGALVAEVAAGAVRLACSALASLLPAVPAAAVPSWVPSPLAWVVGSAATVASWAAAFPLAVARWACPPTLLFADVSLGAGAGPTALLYLSWLALLAAAAVAAAPLAAVVAAGVAWMGRVENAVLGAVLTRRGVTANDVLAGLPLSPLASWLAPAAGSRPDAAVATFTARKRPVPSLPPVATVDSVDVRVALLGMAPARSLTRYMTSFPPPPSHRASGGGGAMPGVVAATLSGVPTVLYRPPPWVTLRRYRMAQLRGLGVFGGGGDGPPAFDPSAWEVPTAWTRTSKWLAASTRAVSAAAVAAGGYTVNRTTLAGVETRRGLSTTGAVAAATGDDGSGATAVLPAVMTAPLEVAKAAVHGLRVVAVTLRGGVVPDGDTGAAALQVKYGEPDSGPEGFTGAIPFLEPTAAATAAYGKAVGALPRVSVGPLPAAGRLAGAAGLSGQQLEALTAWRARLMCGEYALASGDAFAVAPPDAFAGPALADMWACLAAAWGNVPQTQAEAQLVLHAVGEGAWGGAETSGDDGADFTRQQAAAAAALACAPSPPAFLRLLRDAVLSPAPATAPAAMHASPLPVWALVLQHAAAALGPRAAAVALGGGGAPLVPLHTARDFVTADASLDARSVATRGLPGGGGGGGGDGSHGLVSSRAALTRHGVTAAAAMIAAAVTGHPAPTRQLLPGRPDSSVALRLPGAATITRTLCGLRAALQELSLSATTPQLAAAAANAGRHASAIVSFVSPDAVGVGAGGGADKAAAVATRADVEAVHAYALSATPVGQGGTLTSGEVSRILADRSGDTWRKLWWAATGVVDATTVTLAAAAAAYTVPPVHAAQEAAAEATRKAADAAAEAAVKAAAAAAKAGAAPERASLFATPRLPDQTAPATPLWVANARLLATVAWHLLSPLATAVGNVYTVVWEWPWEWACGRWSEHYLVHWSDFADRTWAAWHRQVTPVDPVKEGVVFAGKEHGDRVLRAALATPALPAHAAVDADMVGDAVTAAGKAARAANLPGVWELAGALPAPSAHTTGPALATLSTGLAHPASAAAVAHLATATAPTVASTAAAAPPAPPGAGDAPAAANVAWTPSRTPNPARRRSGGNLVSPLAATAWRPAAIEAVGAAVTAAPERSLHRAYVPPATARRAMLLAVACVALPLAWVCWSYPGARLITWPDISPAPPPPLTASEYNEALLRYRYEVHQWRYRYGPGSKHPNPPAEPTPPPSPDAPPPAPAGVTGALLAAGRGALWLAAPLRWALGAVGVPFDDVGVGVVPSTVGWQAGLVAGATLLAYAVMAASSATTYTVHLSEADHVAAVLEVVKVLLDAGRADDAGGRLVVHHAGYASFPHRAALLALQASTASVRLVVHAAAAALVLAFIGVSHAVAVAASAASHAIGIAGLPAVLVVTPRAARWLLGVALDGARLTAGTAWWAARSSASYARATCCCCCGRRDGDDDFPPEENPNPYDLFSAHSASLHLAVRSPAAATAALLSDYRAVLAALDMVTAVLVAGASRDTAGVTAASLPAVMSSVSGLAVALAQYALSPRYIAAPAYITTVGGTIRDVFPTAAAWGDAAGALCASALLAASDAGNAAAAGTMAAGVAASSLAVVGHLGPQGAAAPSSPIPLPPHARPAVAALLMGE